MNIFRKLKRNNNFNLKKSDFKTEKEECEIKITFISEKFAKSIAEFKEKQGIPEREKTDKIISVTNYTEILMFGNKVRVQYDPTELQIEENIFLSKVNQKLEWIANNEKNFNTVITEKLLPLKNENWMKENERELTKKEFINRIRLTSILVFDDTSLELSYDDGNIFWKHQIIVNLSKENEITNIDING